MQVFRRPQWLSYYLDLKGYSVRAPAAVLNPSRLSALRPSGRSENPGEVALVDTLDREHHDGRGIIRVRRPDAAPHRFGERGPGLHEHDRFLSELDRAFQQVD